MEKNELIIWMITPPNNVSNFIAAVGARWKERVILISCHKVREERALTGYGSVCKNMDEQYILDNVEDRGSFVRDFMQRHREAVHVFWGIHREPAPYMYYLRKCSQDAKIAAVSEKPALNAGKFYVRAAKKLSAPIFYRYLMRKAQRCVNTMFVCSLRGIGEFRKYGWKKKIYNFMYCDGNPSDSLEPESGDCIRFLYVGRFDYRMRGLDILMKCFDLLKGVNWKLDIVGGYGKKKEEVLAWAEKNAQVTYGGTWAASEVQSRMESYDVYICPCREDSWNGQINLALCAGLGVISTDQAGSDELVKASGAGLVVSAGDVKAMESALRYAIEHREKVVEWKRKARAYAPCISAEVVADYFCSVLEYSFLGSVQQPECPWHKGGAR